MNIDIEDIMLQWRAAKDRLEVGSAIKRPSVHVVSLETEQSESFG